MEFPAVFLIGMMEGTLPNERGDVEEERDDFENKCFMAAITDEIAAMIVGFSKNLTSDICQPGGRSDI